MDAQILYAIPWGDVAYYFIHRANKIYQVTLCLNQVNGMAEYTQKLGARNPDEMHYKYLDEKTIASIPIEDFDELLNLWTDINEITDEELSKELDIWIYTLTNG